MIRRVTKYACAGADLGGFGGGRENPPGCPKKNFFFALKIRKRNKARAIHCTVTPARVKTELADYLGVLIK